MSGVGEGDNESANYFTFTNFLFFSLLSLSNSSQFFLVESNKDRSHRRVISQVNKKFTCF